MRPREVESDRLNRRVEFEALHEAQPSEEDGAALAEKPRRSILTHNETSLDHSPGPRADLLLQSLDLPVDQLQEVWPEVAVRAQRALAEYEARS